ALTPRFSAAAIFRHVTNVVAAIEPALNAGPTWHAGTLFISSMLSALFLGRTAARLMVYCRAGNRRGRVVQPPVTGARAVRPANTEIAPLPRSSRSREVARSALGQASRSSLSWRPLVDIFDRGGKLFGR